MKYILWLDLVFGMFAFDIDHRLHSPGHVYTQIFKKHRYTESNFSISCENWIIHVLHYNFLIIKDRKTRKVACIRAFQELSKPPIFFKNRLGFYQVIIPWTKCIFSTEVMCHFQMRAFAFAAVYAKTRVARALPLC